MRRPRPDPVAAGARLAALRDPGPVGGWVPAPAVDEEEPGPERSWSNRPAAADGWLTGLVPAGLRDGRWDPGRRGALALAAVAALAALLAAYVVLRGRPHELPAPSTLPAAAVPSAATGSVVVVDVAGKVRHPGIVRLPFGSRVDDALRAAGGPLPGASFDGLNRARKLADGEQVLVGVAGAAAGGTAAAGDGRVDLNAADVAALDGLPGIGPVLAQKIVDWRTEHGRFASVDQLREVGGIGESKYAALKNKVRV